MSSRKQNRVGRPSKYPPEFWRDGDCCTFADLEDVHRGQTNRKASEDSEALRRSRPLPGVRIFGPAGTGSYGTPPRARVPVRRRRRS